MPSSPELSDTAAEDQVETEKESPPPPPPDGENGHENGETKESNDDESDLSDVEALVMQEAEQEIAVEERIRDAYRTAAEAEAEAGNLKASPKPASVQEIVYCEGEEGKVTEIQGGNSIEGNFFLD